MGLIHIHGNEFNICSGGYEIYDPKDEVWEFTPGSFFFSKRTKP